VSKNKNYGVQLGRAFNWEGCSIGKGVQLGRAFNWEGHSIGKGIQLGRAFTHNAV